MGPGQESASMITRAKPTMLRDLAPSGKREVHKTEQEETKVG